MSTIRGEGHELITHDQKTGQRYVKLPMPDEDVMGKVEWIYGSDEDFADITNADPQINRCLCEALNNDLDRFVQIPALDCADDNERLHKFLRLGWTEDDEQ